MDGRLKMVHGEIFDLLALAVITRSRSNIWRSRFAARREEARRLYGERFCRTGEFYLAASECGFR
jgi:hypothetical protein